MILVHVLSAVLFLTGIIFIINSPAALGIGVPALLAWSLVAACCLTAMGILLVGWTLSGLGRIARE